MRYNVNSLKNLREEAGLSQKDVSKKLGYTTPQFISNWERGVSYPPFKDIKKIAKIYSAEPMQLFRLVWKLRTKSDFKQALKRARLNNQKQKN